MSDRRPGTRRVVVGFLVALALLFVLLYVVGIGDVTAALLQANPAVVGGVLLAVVAWTLAWSGSLYLVMRSFDVRPGGPRTVGIFLTMMYWDNVTPFSTFAADPFAAWTVSTAADVD